MLRKLLATAGASLVALAGAAAAFYLYAQPAELRVAAPRGGPDFGLMSAAAGAFARNGEPIRLKLVPVADAAAGAKALEAGEAELAVLRSDAVLPPAARALVILHRDAALLVAPGGSKLRRPSDLRGRRIGVVEDEGNQAANARLLETILAQYDVSPTSFALVPLAPGAIGEAFARKRIDAVFAVGATSVKLMSGVVREIASSSAKPPVFIPIDEAKAIAKRAPTLEAGEIVRGAFGGAPPRPKEALETSSAAVLLVAHHSLTSELAGGLTRQIFANRAAIAATEPLANSMEAPATAKGNAIPLHPGAEDFLDGNEHGFFDKYSDFIYLGAMLVSLAGSATAALATRLYPRAGSSEEITRKLLEVLQASRAASSSGELDGYEQDVDELLASSLANAAPRDAQAAELHLVALALGQARLAIQDRRRTLTDASERINDWIAPQPRGAANRAKPRATSS